MSEENSDGFSMMERTNLVGQVGMILCWYWGDDEDEEPGHEGETMIRSVELVPSFLRGEFDEFTSGDWWLFLDALGSYPERNGLLDELYSLAKEGYDGKLEFAKAKNYLLVETDDDNDRDCTSSNGMPD